MVQLHAFSDTSQKVGTACMYIRSVDKQGKIMVHLTYSKTALSKLQNQTVPHLALNAAFLATTLANKISKCLDIEDVTLWLNLLIHGKCM
jgi:hypothetical protein